MSPQRICLGLALSSTLAEQIRDLLPAGDILHNHPVAAYPDILAETPSADAQLILFVPASVWENLPLETRSSITATQACQLALVADSAHSHALEFMASGQFMTVMTPPLDAEKITRVLTLAEEVAVLYGDIFKMAQEISLERELLARKNEQLSFLNQILTTASKSLDPLHILGSCAQDLRMLVDVQTVLAVMWETEESHLHAELFMPEKSAPQTQELWTTHLLSVVQRFGKANVHGYQMSFLSQETPDNALPPELTQLITLPLSLGESVFGALIICSEEAATLGQDRVRILHSAANHLALALHNSLEFRKLKARADHDGLTRISNRQNFDMRLHEEMKRHQRHNQELSLLMLDLDFFKSVNDTYGHLAGDMVLREVGKILQNTLRESDFPARYGGEEFVVILPQTSEDHAWILAERIRTKIARTVFRFHEKQFRVTASIGVSGIRPCALTPINTLIDNADQALYRAKTGGRNMVCCSALEEHSLATS